MCQRSKRCASALAERHHVRSCKPDVCHLCSCVKLYTKRRPRWVHIITRFAAVCEMYSSQHIGYRVCKWVNMYTLLTSLSCMVMLLMHCQYMYLGWKHVQGASPPVLNQCFQDGNVVAQGLATSCGGRHHNVLAS